MRSSPTVVVALLAVLTVAGTGAQKPNWQEQLRRDMAMDPAELARRPPPSPAPPPAVLPLPKPTITEAFGIGEALYDLSRTPEAIVSLLSQMNIAIISDAPGASAAGGLRLDESEVRALIALAEDDLANSTDLANLPYTFADLHAAVAGLLPKLTVEQLAEAYSRAYEGATDALVPGVMMGQPITPETRLTRAHIWLLLMDGFAGPAERTARWGTADRMLPDLPSPNPQWTTAEWKEVIARLPLIANRLLAVDSPLVAKQGTAGPGQPLNITARVSPQPPAFVSRASGKTLLQPRAGTLAGQQVTWEVDDDSVLHEIGTLATETGEPVSVGQDGVARFVYQIGADSTGGRGIPMEEWGWVDASVQARTLVSSAYTIPGSTLVTETRQPVGVGQDGVAPVADQPGADITHVEARVQARATPWALAVGRIRARANIRLGWRAPQAITLLVINYYTDISFDIPGLGGGTRSGRDTVTGRLSLRRDGTYRGTVDAVVIGDLILRGGDTPCNAANQWGSMMEQQLYVIGRPIEAFGITHELSDYMWVESGGANGRLMSTDPPDGYLSLEFFPAGAPRPYNNAITNVDPCQPALQAHVNQWGYGWRWFAPFNDAQWTIAHAGYGIALQRSAGGFKYMDLTSAKTPVGSSQWLVIVFRYQPR